MIMIVVLMFEGPAGAAQIYYQLNEEPDQTYDDVTVDGAYIVNGFMGLTLENSFSGWGDLSGYSDLTATLTFTWHDDTLSWGYGSMSSTGQTADPPDGIPYNDLAIVSLDGTQVFSDVEVGEAGSTDPTVYEYVLTDLSLLDDDPLAYLIEADFEGGRLDFIVDSVALEITGTPVPVPAAVWLLGSGLLGLIGIRRRKNRAAAMGAPEIQSRA
jgi:hypothetical protein